MGYGDWYDYYGNYSDYYGDWYDYYGNYSDYYGDYNGDYAAWGMGRKMPVKKMMKAMKAKKFEARNDDYYGDYYGDYNGTDYYGDWYDYYGNYYGDYMAAGRKMAPRMPVKKAHPNK